MNGTIGMQSKGGAPFADILVWQSPILAILIFTAGALSFMTTMPRLHYSEDSWAYWELTQTVFGDFYRITTWRSFTTNIPYSSAFPPLWPAANAVVAAAFRTGPYTLVLTNLMVLATFATVSAAAGRVVFGSSAVGLVAVLIAFTDPTWTSELLGGRTIPLQMTLIAALIAVLASSLGPAWRYALAGVLCGLMLLNRFDAPPLVAVIGLSLLAGRDRRYAPLFLLAVAPFILLWVGYSFRYFGALFVTDSRMVAASTDPLADLTDWRQSWAPLLWDNPEAWLSKLLGNIHPLIIGVRASKWTWAICLGLLAAAAVLAGGLGWRRSLVIDRGTVVRPAFALLATGLALAATLPLYLITGYTDERYFAPMRWLAGFAGVGILASTLTWVGLRRAGSGAVLCLGVLLAGYRIVMLAGSPMALQPDESFAHPLRHTYILDCLAGQPPSTLLFLDNNEHAARFGALTGHPAAYLPRNLPGLTTSDQQEFLLRYHIGAVTWSSPAGERLARMLGAIPKPGCEGVAHIPQSAASTIPER